MTEYSESTVSLKWEEPEDDGGCEITHYVLEKRDKSRNTWGNKMSSPDLEYTATKLVKDKQYFFRVAAENKCGVGPFVELTDPVTCKNPFGELVFIVNDMWFLMNGNHLLMILFIFINYFCYIIYYLFYFLLK